MMYKIIVRTIFNQSHPQGLLLLWDGDETGPFHLTVAIVNISQLFSSSHTNSLFCFDRICK